MRLICRSLFCSLSFAFLGLLTLPPAAQAQVTIYSENIGIPSSTTNVNTYTGWQNPSPIAYSTTTNSDVRTTNASSGYTGASAQGNVYLGTSAARDFLISGINSTGYTNLVLQFGLKRESGSSGDLVVEISSDGITWTALTITEPSNSNWGLVVASGTIPATANLRIRFKKSINQYRIDDISLIDTTPVPSVHFNAATASASENAGTATITLTLSPSPSVSGTVTIAIGAAATATYGTDYTTLPTGTTGYITVNFAAGASACSFTINLLNEAYTEPDETIPFTITGTTGGVAIASPSSCVFTILNDDSTPTVYFTTANRSVLESNTTPQTFTLTFLPSTHPSGTLTITISNGPGAIYTSDYTTNPVGSTGTFTIVFGPSTPSVSFTATSVVDALPEATEVVTFNITAVPAGMLIGSDNSGTFTISDDDSPPTVLAPGDLGIVGMNANDNACDGGSLDDYDYVSFFSFKEILYGTELIITDNGYERCYAGKWGNQEGTVRMKRTGPAIPAGQVITFRIKSGGTPNIISVAPDAGWSCTSIGIAGTSIAMNSGGEQLFFMQGGTWIPGTSNSNNATYNGTVLYAFSTNPAVPWTASCSTDPNQRSNLPPGVECFSMAPTLASDFNKYAGAITPATQRDWIIRLDQTADWMVLANCAGYNSTGYDWMSAPKLPIIPGPMTHGLWRGSTNTDWFECKNWDDARVPDAATDVVINNAALRNCEVGLSPGVNPGGTGVCASLMQSYSTVPVFSLIVKNNSTLNIGGPLKILHSAGAGIVYTRVDTNATLTADTVRMTGYTTSALQAMLRAEAPGSMVRVTGDLSIGQGGYLDLSGSLGGSGTLQIGGNFINTDGEAQFSEPYSLVTFNGNSNQNVNNPGFQEKFYNLRMSKPGGALVLNAPVAITNQLDLTAGQIISTATNLVTINNTAGVVNTSDASFVNGPVQKIGSTDFTFPVGKGTSYRPASVRNLSASGIFTGEYFAQNPEVAVGPLMAPTTLNHISHCEYWVINRTGATPNARVALTWDTPESCGVTAGALGELRVARWTGSNWDDRGNGGTTGNATAGEVVTAAVEPLFSPWTLASVTQNNPLPIELLSFTAEASGDVVQLRWSTASERDNNYFTVERSSDAASFQDLLRVPGAGNSQAVLNYADVDPAPLNGWSYYRLRQTDYDGMTSESAVVPVLFHRSGRSNLSVRYSGEQLLVSHDFAPGSLMEVLDLTGRVVSRQTISVPALAPIGTSGLAHGAYVLRVSNAERTESTQFVW